MFKKLLKRVQLYRELRRVQDAKDVALYNQDDSAFFHWYGQEKAIREELKAL